MNLYTIIIVVTDILQEITPFMNSLTQILLSHERKTKTELSAQLDSWMSNLSPDTESPSQ